MTPYGTLILNFYLKVKEVDLYSAFIVVPLTQGAQVRFTQYYLQITPYLPLPRKRSPDGGSYPYECEVGVECKSLCVQ